MGAAEHTIPSEEDVRKEPGEGINMANAGGQPEKETQYMLNHCFDKTVKNNKLKLNCFEVQSAELT